ncbi:type VI secretion system-associated protein TagF [Methylosinus sp. H3A]|uniref:type VI secretion system-associated protein TagF n=1 Tax=Methylosinus sp. H3A TaxID=2785786 RepID=UPI0018C29CE7|nr:type VI secretion system-associated protein TagF [Methylosinus sp. H3A]MBG0809502.1 type VI secretion system-associated protein TagF [Methylosinus sp. H3A]
MRRGLFGKLQAKRDFVSQGAPRGFLTAFEPWLQGGVASSRAQLGAEWRAAYLTAPIWRFWLGPQLCGGATAIGAFMPSMDGVGRYFPFSVAMFAEEGESLPPPEADPQDGWFVAIEDFLLSTLEQGVVFESVLEALEALPAPALGATGARLLTPETVAAARVGEAGFGEACRLARETVARARAVADQSFWWTEGGDGFERFALAATGMPDPALFVAMITGRFTSPAPGGEARAP